MEKAFEIKNLNKAYKDFALKNVNLSLPKGYIMGFVYFLKGGVNAVLLKSHSIYINACCKICTTVAVFAKTNNLSAHCRLLRDGIFPRRTAGR